MGNWLCAQWWWQYSGLANQFPVYVPSHARIGKGIQAVQSELSA